MWEPGIKNDADEIWELLENDFESYHFSSDEESNAEVPNHENLALSPLKPWFERLKTNKP